jgi:lipopolysaccharide export system ATP-binding protein
VVAIPLTISYLKDRGIGILMSDHNVHETLSIIDRAYVIHGGQILVEGGPQEIVGNDRVREVFLGDRFRLR